MATKANYFKIGLFVIVSVTLIVTCLIVFGSGSFFQQKIYFETYLDESVQGLDVGSPVKHRGVKIGQVEKITFVMDEYKIDRTIVYDVDYRGYVMIIMSINNAFMKNKDQHDAIKFLTSLRDHNFRIRLTSHALTGVAWLETDVVDPNLSPPIKIVWEPKNFYMPSSPSLISKFIESAETAFRRFANMDFEGIMQKTEKLLVTLDTNVEQAKVPELSEEVRAFFSEIRQTNADVKKMIGAAGVELGGATIKETIGRLDKTISNIDSLITTEKPDIAEIISNIKAASVSLKELAADLKVHPSRAVFSKPPVETEVYKK
ncbi:MAG TPA: MlaD family protein [Sedimentisphaerales bacterium]|nr:MlaD family protein [Sedimentisphaerales bacterium]